MGSYKIAMFIRLLLGGRKRYRVSISEEAKSDYERSKEG